MRVNNIEIDAKHCNQIEKFLGLMFTSKKRAKILLFEFKKPVKIAIHSWYVFFPFLAIWLDNKNKIIELKKVNPFSFYIRPKKEYYKLLEVPINKKYEKICRVLTSSVKRKI